jgi:hypothetical protein
MKIKLVTLLLSLITTGLMASFSYAQIVTVTGNYCARTSASSRQAAYAFLVDSEEVKGVLTAELKLSGRGAAKLLRFNPKTIKVGDEFIIKYDDTDVMGPTILALTGTGRRKPMKPCKM